MGNRAPRLKHVRRGREKTKDHPPTGGPNGGSRDPYVYHDGRRRRLKGSTTFHRNSPIEEETMVVVTMMVKKG